MVSTQPAKTDAAAMTRRQLEDWVAANREALFARGVTVLFGFGASTGRAAGASWASFLSARGSGRLIRGADGSSRVDAYAFADGACLRQARDDDLGVAQLDSLADLLALRRG